jgi:hypothetical protein
MKEEIRKRLAQETFEEKIRKVDQLVRLAKTFPRRAATISRQTPPRPAAKS